MMNLDVFENDELLALAYKDFENNELDDALYKLKHLLSKEQAYTESYSLIARLYAKLGLYPKARHWYQKYVEQNPGAIVERFQLGLTYHDEGSSSKALKLWDEVLRDEANYPPALFYKALVLAEGGNTTEANVLLQQLVNSSPADNLYVEQGRDLIKTIKNRSIKLSPDGPNPANNEFDKNQLN